MLLGKNGGLNFWVIDLTYCWTFVHCPQVLCGCHSGVKCHMLTIFPLANGHQLKQKEKVQCFTCGLSISIFIRGVALLNFFKVYRFEVYVKYIFAYTGVLLYVYKYADSITCALRFMCFVFPRLWVKDESRSVFVIDPSFTCFFCFVCSPVVLVWLADDGWQWLPVGFGLCCVSFF